MDARTTEECISASYLWKKVSQTYCPKVLTLSKFLKDIITPMQQIDVKRLVTVQLKSSLSPMSDCPIFNIPTDWLLRDSFQIFQNVAVFFFSELIYFNYYFLKNYVKFWYIKTNFNRVKLAEWGISVYIFKKFCKYAVFPSEVCSVRTHHVNYLIS